MNRTPQQASKQAPMKPAGNATALIKLLAAQIVAEHFAARAANDTQPRDQQHERD